MPANDGSLIVLKAINVRAACPRYEAKGRVLYEMD
jgi:hypothetical protein